MSESSPASGEAPSLEKREGEPCAGVSPGAAPRTLPPRGRKAFSLQGCTAIITGASGGLGAEFAKQLADRAACLILAARSAEKLQKLALDLGRPRPMLSVETVACDLATEEGRRALWEKVDSLDVAPNVLINNAGHGDYGGFAAGDEARIASQIDLNITALTMMTHRFLRRVQATADRPAAVLHVSSLAASTPVPDLTVYAATKSYVTAFSEGLAIEYARKHVRMLAVCPGPTPTNFSSAARRADGMDTDRSGQGILRMPPEKVVSIALKSLESGKRRVHPGAWVSFAAFLFEKMPRWLLRAVLAARYRRSQRSA
jgi:short-subunit dehydrogenase